MMSVPFGLSSGAQTTLTCALNHTTTMDPYQQHHNYSQEEQQSISSYQSVATNNSQLVPNPFDQSSTYFAQVLNQNFGSNTSCNNNSSFVSPNPSGHSIPTSTDYYTNEYSSGSTTAPNSVSGSSTTTLALTSSLSTPTTIEQVSPASYYSAALQHHQQQIQSSPVVQLTPYATQTGEGGYHYFPSYSQQVQPMQHNHHHQHHHYQEQTNSYIAAASAAHQQSFEHPFLQDPSTNPFYYTGHQQSRFANQLQGGSYHEPATQLQLPNAPSAPQSHDGSRSQPQQQQPQQQPQQQSQQQSHLVSLEHRGLGGGGSFADIAGVGRPMQPTAALGAPDCSAQHRGRAEDFSAHPAGNSLAEECAASINTGGSGGSASGCPASKNQGSSSSHADIGGQLRASIGHSIITPVGKQHQQQQQFGPTQQLSGLSASSLFGSLGAGCVVATRTPFDEPASRGLQAGSGSPMKGSAGELVGCRSAKQQRRALDHSLALGVSGRPRNLNATKRAAHQGPAPTSSGGSGIGAAMISRRKNATRETTATLKDWLDEHGRNPYPTKGEKIMLSIITKMSLTQVSTWFANARRRMKKESKGAVSNTWSTTCAPANGSAQCSAATTRPSGAGSGLAKIGLIGGGGGSGRLTMDDSSSSSSANSSPSPPLRMNAKDAVAPQADSNQTKTTLPVVAVANLNSFMKSHLSAGRLGEEPDAESQPCSTISLNRLAVDQQVAAKTASNCRANEEPLAMLATTSANLSRVHTIQATAQSSSDAPNSF